jgi:hypothetical protein
MRAIEFSAWTAEYMRNDIFQDCQPSAPSCARSSDLRGNAAKLVDGRPNCRTRPRKPERERSAKREAAGWYFFGNEVEAAA